VESILRRFAAEVATNSWRSTTTEHFPRTRL
jgi:hypothetical protein